jgi:hypothetical protein
MTNPFPLGASPLATETLETLSKVAKMLHVGTKVPCVQTLNDFIGQRTDVVDVNVISTISELEAVTSDDTSSLKDHSRGISLQGSLLLGSETLTSSSLMELVCFPQTFALAKNP